MGATNGNVSFQRRLQAKHTGSSLTAIDRDALLTPRRTELPSDQQPGSADKTAPDKASSPLPPEKQDSAITEKDGLNCDLKGIAGFVCRLNSNAPGGPEISGRLVIGGGRYPLGPGIGGEIIGSYTLNVGRSTKATLSEVPLDKPPTAEPPQVTLYAGGTVGDLRSAMFRWLGPNLQALPGSHSEHLRDFNAPRSTPTLFAGVETVQPQKFGQVNFHLPDGLVLRLGGDFLKSIFEYGRWKGGPGNYLMVGMQGDLLTLQDPEGVLLKIKVTSSSYYIRGSTDHRSSAPTSDVSPGQSPNNAGGLQFSITATPRVLGLILANLKKLR